MQYKRKDFFYKKAKKEHKASRAAYKLSEIQRRYDLVKKGNIVIDLGCAPGSWMQELSVWVGKKGKVLGIDRLPLHITLPNSCEFIQGDIMDDMSINNLYDMAGSKVNVIVSDMAPNISGIDFADAYHSYELGCLALNICHKILIPGGHFVLKIFPGAEFDDFMTQVRSCFLKVNAIIPEATRRTSIERYIVARGFKGRNCP